ncbi:MAG: S8 family peptidase [Halioglobus sp.]|nr:S8 family peptidase [Halioglobus sp.]
MRHAQASPRHLFAPLQYALILSLSAVFATPSLVASAAPQTSLVMLQGKSARELRALVERQGGRVTHDLPIIDAVGARLTPEQLRAALRSPLVGRHIDDLDVLQPPDHQDELARDNCKVAGAIELSLHGTQLQWPLYNKAPAPVVLEQMELTWPAHLGTIAAIALGGSNLDPALFQQLHPGSANLQLAGHARIELAQQADLRIRFSGSPTASTGIAPEQGDFTITLHFSGDCSTSLMPAYPDNHHDFYYAGAADVNILHRHGVTGRGVTVAVLDSGLWEHDALAQDTAGRPRIVARYDATNDRVGPEVFDDSGHGTHMTSVLAHSGQVIKNGEPTGTFKGIAPDASLVAVKAFDVEGHGGLLDIVRGVQWVVENRQKYNIQVLNLSFAARPRWHYWLDPVNQAVMQAWASGITVVVAAGNEGPELMSIGSPGNLPYVITVGAFTDSWTPDTTDDDYIPDFSSQGPTPTAHIKPDLVAPGGHITGVTRPGSSLTREYPEYLLSTGEFVMTGSSQAAALVSGIVALLLQLEPGLSPDDVKCKLLSSAEPAINRDGLLAYSPFQQGHGRVSAARAVALGERGCGNQELDIQLDIANAKHFEGPAIVDEEGSASLPGLKAMLSPEPAEKGLSRSRKWGVKAHIERTDPPDSSPDSPFDWQALYRREKATMEHLARSAPE